MAVDKSYQSLIKRYKSLSEQYAKDRSHNIYLQIKEVHEQLKDIEKGVAASTTGNYARKSN